MKVATLAALLVLTTKMVLRREEERGEVLEEVAHGEMLAEEYFAGSSRTCEEDRDAKFDVMVISTSVQSDRLLEALSRLDQKVVNLGAPLWLCAQRSHLVWQKVMGKLCMIHLEDGGEAR